MSFELNTHFSATSGKDGIYLKKVFFNKESETYYDWYCRGGEESDFSRQELTDFATSYLEVLNGFSCEAATRLTFSFEKETSEVRLSPSGEVLFARTQRQKIAAIFERVIRRAPPSHARAHARAVAPAVVADPVLPRSSSPRASPSKPLFLPLPPQLPDSPRLSPSPMPSATRALLLSPRVALLPPRSPSSDSPTAHLHLPSPPVSARLLPRPIPSFSSSLPSLGILPAASPSLSLSPRGQPLSFAEVINGVVRAHLLHRRRDHRGSSLTIRSGWELHRRKFQILKLLQKGDSPAEKELRTLLVKIATAVAFRKKREEAGLSLDQQDHRSHAEWAVARVWEYLSGQRVEVVFKPNGLPPETRPIRPVGFFAPPYRNLVSQNGLDLGACFQSYLATQVTAELDRG